MQAFRVGMLKHGFEDIYAHPWFKGAKFRWGHCREGTLSAPWTPRMVSAEDTQYFDEFDDEDAVGEPFRGNQAVFRGF